MTDGQPELFQVAMVGDREVVRGPSLPEPPTGPRKAPPRKAANTREAYWAWRKTEDGKKAWAGIRDMALGSLKAGESRISAKSLVELERGAEAIEINNTYTAYVADELVERYPALLPLIERRRRKKA